MYYIVHCIYTIYMYVYVYMYMFCRRPAHFRRLYCIV